MTRLRRWALEGRRRRFTSGARGQRAALDVTRRHSDSERGSASVWVLAIGLAVVMFGGFGASIGAAVVARHRAQAAADLGALAAAVHALEGQEAACKRAATVVSANAARLVSCTVTGLEAVVTAEADAAGLAAALRPARASARAGPAT